MSAIISPDNVLSFPRPSLPRTPPTPDDYQDLRHTDTPLVIDNGATTLRWGFATSESPRCQPNVITKYRERKTNRPLLLFGDAVDIEGGAKAQARTPWEGDVLLNFDALVGLLLSTCASAIGHVIVSGKRARLRLSQSRHRHRNYCPPHSNVGAHFYAVALAQS